MEETTLIVEVPEAEHVASRWRLQHDPPAEKGMPAHITALYPFSPPDTLSIEMVEEVQRIVSTVEPFGFVIDSLDEFPGVLWLRPDPDDRFRSLTRLLWDAFPDYPPYGGRYPSEGPHLTLAQGVEPGSAQVALRNEIEATVAGQLPLTCCAKALSIFTSNDQEQWERIHLLPFGSA